MCDRPYCTCSAYDALLAERDALKATADLSPDNASLEGTIAILDEWRYKENNEPFPLSGSKVRELCESVIALRAELAASREDAKAGWTEQAQLAFDCYALAQELAALKEKSTEMHESIRDGSVGCYCWLAEGEHKTDCVMHPDFLTTSATEATK